MERIEEFTEFLSSTALYAELKKEFTTFEIFEVTKGKFEIPVVQESYERFLKQDITNLKRSQFNKDLNKLISGEYVVVPKRCSDSMAQACADFMKEYLKECDGYNPWGMWKVMWEQAVKETNQITEGKSV